MEQRTEVKTIQVDFKCPKCNIGFMRPTGYGFTTNETHWPHRCDSLRCDYEEQFINKTYPYIVYEPIAQSNTDSIVGDTPGMA